MIRIIDHMKEKESVLQLNLARILRALGRGEKVTVYHPVGKIHGRLAGIEGVEYVASRGLGVYEEPKIVLPRYLLANYADPMPVRTNMPTCNATLFRWNGRVMLLGRETNYAFRRDDSRKVIGGWMIVHGWPSKQHCYTNEVLYEFDMRTNEAKKVGYLSYVQEKDRRRLNYIGYEDVRLMEWDGEMTASFTVVDNSHNFTMGHAKVNPDLTLGKVIKVPTRNAVEKNWLPIEGRPHWYVYSFRPYSHINMMTGAVRNMGKGTDYKLRGSSPVIVHRGMRICLAHINNWPACKTYVHVFVIFDEDMGILKVTAPFSFFGAAIEFNTSLVSDGDNLEIIFSVNDQLPYRITIGPELFERIISDRLDDANPAPDLYGRLYADAKANQNFKAAIGLATFVDWRGIRADALRLLEGLPDISKENRDTMIRQLNAP